MLLSLFNGSNAEPGVLPSLFAASPANINVGIIAAIAAIVIGFNKNSLPTEPIVVLDATPAAPAPANFPAILFTSATYTGFPGVSPLFNLLYSAAPAATAAAVPPATAVALNAPPVSTFAELNPCITLLAPLKINENESLNPNDNCLKESFKLFNAFCNLNALACICSFAIRCAYPTSSISELSPLKSKPCLNAFIAADTPLAPLISNISAIALALVSGSNLFKPA